jgi:serine/threonine protein kinase/class 3 adenylate cyclase
VVIDETMPALFAASASGSVDDVYQPIAQLGVGVDGIAVLARRGGQLAELVQLTFGASSPRWPTLETRVRAIAAVDHPAIRKVLALETEPPTVILEGDSSPPLAELVEQTAVDLPRAMNILGELARAVAAGHHVGIAHGHLDPWTVHVGAGDRPRLELTGLATRPTTHAWSAKCVAPELADGTAADAAADVYALGALLDLFATAGNRAMTDGVRAIIADATANDPEARPSAHELVRKLVGAGTVVARTTMREIDTARPPRPGLGMQLGRFELVRQLGAGAMGEVWEARDQAGGPNVAIKLLKPEIAADAELLRRFRKEARVLAKVGSPFIANFIDLNEDKGFHYLVLELVSGGSVAGALRRLGKLPERLSLGIIADTCRALAEPHRLGIVHRDIKPDNLMFVRAGIELETQPIGQLVKLGDFGIARLVEQQAGPEGATREGAVLGTPEFMAPEQCQGAQVTAATDVYALGCCLFGLIAGRPPFVTQDDNQMAVILQHLREPPPRLDSVFAEVSPPVADLVAQCLEKDPKRRPQDAAELLATIEQLCDGTAALITAHPAPPVVREGLVQTYAFEWELQSSPDALWPFVSNTEKMNRATGLAPVRFEIESIATQGSGGTITTGSQRVAGLALKWREHPYEWIEGSRHVVLRVFEKGVLRWYVAEVTLERLAGGGTRLRNTIRLEPRGWLARVLSKWEIGVKYRRRLERVYTRVDRVLAAGPRPEIDPIDPEVVVSAAAQAHVEEVAHRLAATADARAVDALTAFLLHASDQDVARIRPIELAQRFRVGDDAMIDACLRAANAGLLAMVWDVICPSCKIPSSVVDSLQKIEEHGTCRTCNVGFELDFSRAIELAFRAAPEVRDVETRTFCVGGPSHFPHVVAQVRLQPGERFALPLSLAPGYYLVRSPQLPRSHELRVTVSGGVRRVDLTLGERTETPPLTTGDQLLTLVNPAPREVLVRVERAGDRAFALTAARVMASATFRELFPDQALAPGRLMAVTQATLVVAQLDAAQALFRELGDHKAFPVAARFFEVVAQLAKESGGSLVKTFGGLAIAAFERPGAAVEAALAIQAAIDVHPVTTGQRARVAVHRGPMMALTQSGKLDYFGQNVELALAIAATTPPGAIGLSSAVCQDVGVAERLQTTPDHLGMQPLDGGTWVLHVRARRAELRALPAGATNATVVQ